jgi:hypothetical protein
MSDIIKRLDIENIYQVKLDILNSLKQLENIDNDIEKQLEIIKGYRPYRLNYEYGTYDEKREIKYVDRVCWYYLVGLFELEKYMLCTDYEKMRKEIQDFMTPEFTIENAQGWINGLKSLIYENVNTLIKQVFKRVTEETYLTGGNWYTGKKKKRNNNGIDEFFILSTHDYTYIFGYYCHSPTITDDLEKVCYILSGESLPKITCKDEMRDKKISEYENKYFKIKVCKNNNTHYWLCDDIRNKLNYYGSGEGIIGENIKIKIFDKVN